MKFKDDNQRAHDQNHIRLTENQGFRNCPYCYHAGNISIPGRDT